MSADPRARLRRFLGLGRLPHKVSQAARRRAWLEPLETRALMAANVIDFDNAVAPEGFSMQVPLTTQYSRLGANFGGIGGAGWEVLNNNSGFGVAGYSAPNFLAWNTFLTSAQEVVSFETPVEDVSFQVGSELSGSFAATAFDETGVILGTASVNFNGSLQSLSLPYDRIARIEFSTSAEYGILDNLQYEGFVSQSPNPVVSLNPTGSLVIVDSVLTPHDNQFTISTDGTYLLISDPSVPFTAAPTLNSELRNDGLTLAVLLADVTSIKIIGGGGDDHLLIDYSTGVPVMAGGLQFIGGTGNDMLSITGSGVEDVNYIPSDVPGTDGKQGNFLVDGVGIYFDGLEPVNVSNIATGTVTLAGGDDILTIADGFNYTAPPAATQGVQPAIHVSGTTGGVAIEEVAFWNLTTGLTIDTTAVDGNDSITVLSANGVASAIPSLSIVTGTGADAVNINGAVSLSGALSVSTNVLTTVAAGTIAATGGVVFTNSGTSTIGGIISGTGGFTKSGAGTLNLNALSSYTGNNLITAGLVVAGATDNNNGSFGAFNAAATKIVVQSGATVDINGRGAVDFFYGMTLSGTGTSGQGALINTGVNGGAGNRQVANITLTGNATIGGTGHIYMINGGHAADTLTLNNFTLTKIGTSTFFVNNTTVTSGTVLVNEGVWSANRASNMSAANLVLANTAGVALNLNGYNLPVGSLSGGGVAGGNVILGGNTLTVGALNTTTTFSGIISGTGVLTKTGTGTLTLGAANTYSGGTIVSQGTLANVAATGFGTNTITMADANTAANNVQLTMATNVANNIVVANSGTGTVNLFATAVFSSQAGTITLNRSAILEIPATGNTVDRWYEFGAAGISGAGGLIIRGGSGGTTGSSGANRVVLNGAKTFIGGMVIESGMVQLGGATSAGTGTITFGNANTGTAVTQLRTGANIANPIVISSAAPNSPSAIGTYVATPLFTGPMQVDHPLTIYGGGDRMTWTGAGASWSGSSSITIAANRVTHDTAVSTWSGDMTINAASIFQPGSTTSLISSNNLTVNGTLQLNAVSPTINGLSGASTGIVQNIVGGNTITVGAGNATTTYAGIFRNNSGALSVTKTGTGTLTLTGANVHTGTTLVNGGTLEVATGGSITTSGAIQIGGAATPTLAITGGTVTATGTTNPINIGPTTSNPGALTISSGSLSVPTGDFIIGNSAPGSLTQTGGTITAVGIFAGNNAGSAGSAVNLSDGTFTTTGTFVVGTRSSSTLTVSGSAVLTVPTLQFSHPSGVAGTNTVNLDGGIIAANTVTRPLGTGNFVFNGGTLRARVSSTTFMTGLSAATIAAGGAIIDTNGFDITIGQALLAGAPSGGLTKQGLGTLTLSSNGSSFSGGVAINAGTISTGTQASGSNSSLGARSNARTITVNNGATLAFTTNNVFGGGATDISLLPSIAVAAGGTLTTNNYNVVGSLLLSGGTVTSTYLSGSTYLSYELKGGVSATGATTSTITSTTTTGYNMPGTQIFNVDTGSTLNFNARLANGSPDAGSAVGSLTKTGAGTLVMAAANTYTGTTLISGGIFSVPTGGSISTANPIQVGGSGTPTPTLAISGGSVSTSFATASGYGIEIGPTASNPGAVTISSGTLALTGASQFVIGNNATGTLTQTGGTVTSAGTVYLGNFAGATNSLLDVSAGSFSTATMLLLGTRANSTVNISGTASVVAPAVQFGHASGTSNVKTLNLNGGTLTTGGITQANTAGGFVFNGGLLKVSATNTTFMTGLSSATVAAGGAIIDTNGFDITIGQVLVAGAPSGGLTKNGAGTLTLTGANSFTGNVAANAGTIKLGNTTALGPTNTAITKVVVASGAAVDLNGTIDPVYGYTIAGTGVGGTGAIVNTGGAIGNFTAQTSNIRLTADATIGGTGNFSLLTFGYAPTSLDLAGFTLTKTGTNTFYLVNATVTAGAINIAGGTLSQTNNNKPGGHDLSNVAITLANTAGATLDLGGLNLSVGSISGGGTTGGNSVLGAGRLTVGNLNTSTTYSGLISGTGGLTKVGTGTLTLARGNTFSGTVLANAGTIRLGATNALGATDTAFTKVTVASGAAVDLNGTVDPVYGYTISGTGVGGTGAITNSGGGIGNGLAQTTRIRLAADASIGGTGNFSLLAGGYGPTDLDLAGFTLTKSGTNTFFLVNATVTAGTINIVGGSFSQTNSNKPGGHDLSSVAIVLANNAGATLDLAGINLSVGSITGGGAAGGNTALGGGRLTVGALNTSTTYSGLISGTGGLTKVGTGTLTLARGNSFTGTVLANAGTIRLGATGALGANDTAFTKVTVASGAAVDLNGTVDPVYGYTISGTGVGGTGAITNSGGGIGNGLAQTSKIRLAADASIGGTGNFSLLTFGYATTNLDLAGFTLTKSGTNTFYLVNTTVTAGAINIVGGTFSQTNSNKPGGHDLSSVAITLANTAGVSLDSAGLNLAVGSLSGGGTTGGNTVMGGGRLTVGNLGTSTTYDGIISGTNGLTKVGAGTLTLSAVNPLSGTTTINAGKLLINGSLPGPVIVNPTGTLGGSGTILGTVQVNGGTLAPGASPEILDVGSTTFTSGSTFEVEIDGLTVGTQYDQLNVAGTIDLGNATLVVDASITPDPLTLQTFVVINNDLAEAVTGTFASQPEGSAISVNGGLGTVFISYRGGSGNDVILSSQPIAFGTPGADTVVLTPTATGYDYSVNGGPDVSIPGTIPFTFNGFAGDDYLVVNVTSFPLPTITYDGGAQDLTSRPPNSLGDILRVVGTGGETATYTPSATTTGAGTVVVSGSGGGTINFTGLEPVDITGFATAILSLPSANDVITLTNGFDSAFGTTPAIVATGTSGGVTIESAHFFGNTTVVIDTTISDGDDTITLASADFTHGNTNLAITTGTGADVVNVTGSATFTGGVVITSGAVNFNAGTLSLGGDLGIASSSVQVSAGATISANDIELDVANNVTIAGTVTSGLELTINVDATDLTDVGTGSTIDLTGSVLTTLFGTYLNGGTDADTFILAPQTTTDFYVAGDDPTTSPGDKLTMNVTGLGAALSSPGSIFTGAGSGDWVFSTGPQPVYFGSIENLDITGNYGLAYNNDVTKAANLILMRDVGGTSFELRDGSTVGTLLLSGSLATVLSLTVNGNTVNTAEQLTIDDVNGLPSFSSTPPGSPSVVFNGAGGTNTLSYNLISAGTSQIVTLGNGTIGADSSASVATTNSVPQSLDVSGTSLAAITRTGTGTTPGALQIIAEAGDDDIDVTGSGLTTIITTAGFASVSFDAITSYDSVSILGGDGLDNLQLTSLGGGATNLIPFTLDGGNGADVFGIGSSLAVIGAQVTIIGGVGVDVLNVDNSGSATANTNVVVRESSIDSISARNATGDVLYSTVETLNVTTSTGNDTIRANLGNGASALITATLNGGLGNDQFFLDAATTPSLDFLNLQGGLGSDIFGTAPSGGTGSAVQGGEIIPVTGVQIVISGESSTVTSGPNPTTPATADNDQLNLNISQFATAEVIDTVTGQVISIGAMAAHSPLYFNGIEDLNLFDGGVLTNTIIGDLYLRSTNDGTADNILFYRGYTSDQDVLIRMNNRMVSNTPFRPTTRIVAYGRGGADSMQLNYTAGTVAAEFHGEDGQDDLLGSFQNDLLVGGGGNDQLMGMDGSDILWGDQQALVWADRSGNNLPGSTDGNDILEGRDGNDSLFGGGGHDKLMGMSGNDYLHGGFGNDNLIGADGNDFLRAGDGNDELVGDNGNDIALAGAGDDLVYGSAGLDFHLAGDGSDRIYDLNDSGEDISVTELLLTLDLDTANPAYNPSNPSTFYGPNDMALLALMTTWSGAGSFATRVTAARSLLLPPEAVNDGDIDYMYGNLLAQDYTIAITRAVYTSSTGDEMDLL